MRGGRGVRACESRGVGGGLTQIQKFEYFGEAASQVFAVFLSAQEQEVSPGKHFQPFLKVHRVTAVVKINLQNANH